MPLAPPTLYFPPLSPSYPRGTAPACVCTLWLVCTHLTSFTGASYSQEVVISTVADNWRKCSTEIQGPESGLDLGELPSLHLSLGPRTEDNRRALKSSARPSDFSVTTPPIRSLDMQTLPLYMLRTQVCIFTRSPDTSLTLLRGHCV